MLFYIVLSVVFNINYYVMFVNIIKIYNLVLNAFNHSVSKPNFNMYSCFDIANKFLELSELDRRPLKQMKLLKLVYIAHGFNLAVNDKPLIKEYVEAWQYGPVIRELYYVIKRFGNRPISKDVVEIYSDNKLTNEDEEFIGVIWDIYKDNTGLELSTMTHQSGTPWDKVYNNSRGLSNSIISEKIIKEYYSNKLNS